MTLRVATAATSTTRSQRVATAQIRKKASMKYESESINSVEPTGFTLSTSKLTAAHEPTYPHDKILCHAKSQESASSRARAALSCTLGSTCE